MPFHGELRPGKYPDKYRKTVGEYLKLKFAPGEFEFAQSTHDLSVHRWPGYPFLLSLTNYFQERRIEQTRDSSFPEISGTWTRLSKKDSTYVYVGAGTVKIDGKKTHVAKLTYIHGNRAHGTDAVMHFSRVGDKFFFCWGTDANMSSMQPEDVERGNINEVMPLIFVSEQSNRLLNDLRSNGQNPSKLEEFLFNPFESVLEEHWMHGLGGFQRFKKLFG